MSFPVIRPYDGAHIRDFAADSPSEVNEKIREAADCFARWKKVPFAERAALLKRVGELLCERDAVYGRLMAEEMGKLISEARAESRKCATACDYYAEHAERFLAPREIDLEPSRASGSTVRVVSDWTCLFVVRGAYW